MTAPAAPAAAPKGRLGNGQLRRQVAEYLADHPGPCKTGEIAKALDRSAGAVGNALTTLADNGEADLVPGKPISYQANSSTAAAAAAITPKAPLPHKPAPAPTPAPAPAPAPAAPAPSPAPKPAFTPSPAAAAGPVTRPNGQVYQPRSLADMPDVDALRRLRDAGSAGPAVRAARYREDLANRGGLPRPDHRGWRRRHHRRRPGRRVHPEPRRHLHLHLRAAHQGHAGGAGPVHRRRHPHLAGGAGGRLPRDGRPARDHCQGPQRRDRQGSRRVLRSQPATTPESTARSSPRPSPAGSRSRSGSPPTSTSPTPSRSTPARSRPRRTSPPGRPPARSAGHPSSANSSPTPGSPASSARPPPSPTWSASPPRRTATS